MCEGEEEKLECPVCAASPAPARGDGEAERSWILQKESTKLRIVPATLLALPAAGAESKFGPIIVP